MALQIDFDDLVTKAAWHDALDQILAAARKPGSNGSALQTLLLAYVEQCPFQEYCVIAQQANRALSGGVISSAIDNISARNDDFTAATGEIDDVTEVANKQASGLLLKGPLDALAQAQEALDAIKPSKTAGG